MTIPGGPTIDGVTVHGDVNTGEAPFDECVIGLYELTYKYDMLAIHKWMGDIPKSRVLAEAEMGIRKCSAGVVRVLRQAFETYIELHDWNDPETFARARIDHDLEVEGTTRFGDWYANYLLGVFDYTMRRITDNARGKANAAEAMNRGIIASLRDGKLPYVSELLRGACRELYEQDKEEERRDPEFKACMHDPADLLEEFGDLTTLVAPAMRPEAWRDIAVELYATMVVPVQKIWFRDFLGIGNVLKNMREALNLCDRLMHNQMAFPADELYQTMDRLINITHSGGNMTEYVDRVTSTEGSAQLFDEMSKLDVTELDQDLLAMGMLPEFDTSAVAMRRQKADARAMVRDAWEHMARREWGVEENRGRRKRRARKI